MRYALYFTPDHDHKLTRAGAGWLGRDAFSGEENCRADKIDSAVEEGRQRWTAKPRRYGFHATLVAPFQLQAGLAQDDVLQAAETFAAQSQPFQIQRLELARLDDFLALIPAQKNAELDQLASAAVDHFTSLRAPLDAASIQRREGDHLSDRHRAYLELYGYPYVKEDFRFHMTLTASLTGPEADYLQPILNNLLAPALAGPIAVDTVSLFVEPSPGAPFTVLSTHRLGPNRVRKTV